MHKGSPCDTNGVPLHPGTPPPPRPLPETPWDPYANGVQFKTADFLYRRVEMSAGAIDELLDLWAESMEDSVPPPPFRLTPARLPTHCCHPPPSLSISF